ncbi:MAG: YerC/YecD family TrpR-related protein, partial [bacterium]|nr:YerC/YecD family TrpR-related protein [bacterium]
QMIGEFYDVVASLKTREEVRLFFKDLLMPDEVTTLMRRIEVAALLMAGFTYEKIAKLLGVGRGKVTNVQKSLARGGGGYKIILKRLLDSRKKRLKTQKKWVKTANSSFGSLKQKYPLHFLLFNLIDEISESLGEDKVRGEKEALLFTPFRQITNSTTN